MSNLQELLNDLKGEGIGFVPWCIGLRNIYLDICTFRSSETFKYSGRLSLKMGMIMKTCLTLNSAVVLDGPASLVAVSTFYLSFLQAAGRL